MQYHLNCSYDWSERIQHVTKRCIVLTDEHSVKQENKYFGVPVIKVVTVFQLNPHVNDVDNWAWAEYCIAIRQTSYNVAEAGGYSASQSKFDSVSELFGPFPGKVILLAFFKQLLKVGGAFKQTWRHVNNKTHEHTPESLDYSKLPLQCVILFYYQIIPVGSGSQAWLKS